MREACTVSVFNGGLPFSAVLKQRAPGWRVARFERGEIFLQVGDDRPQLVAERAAVVQKQLGPHLLVEIGDPRQVAEAAGRKAAFAARRLALDVRAGHDVRELRGVGDGAVVQRGGRDHDAPEAELGAKTRQLPESGIDVRHENHRRAAEQAGLRRRIARRLLPRHRVPADEDEAVRPRHGEKRLADRRFHARAVDHERALGEQRRLFADIRDRRARVETDKHDFCAGQRLVGQQAVRVSRFDSRLRGRCGAVGHEHLMAGIGLKRLGQRAADEAKPYDSDAHRLSTGRRRDAAFPRCAPARQTPAA